MRCVSKIILCSTLLTVGMSSGAFADDSSLGVTVESLVEFAKTRNPDYDAMQADADAYEARIAPSGSLPDPKFRTEFRDITRGGEQRPSLVPNQTGSTRYLLMQDIPWAGKRDLKQTIASHEAESARDRAQQTWNEVVAKIKVAYAQLYYVHHTEKLSREVLDLMSRLEKVTQARYTSGLAAQQDVIKAQLEQTSMQNELIALGTEKHHLHARINSLLSRPVKSPLAEPQKLRLLPSQGKLDQETLENLTKSNNPAISSEKAKAKAAEKAVELALRNRYPDVTLGLSPIQYENSIKEWEFMIEMNIPLQQSSRRSQEREAESLLKVARSRQEAVTNQILSELSENLSEIDAIRKVESLITERLLPQSELAFQSALVGYETGRVDFATLLDAQRQIRMAKQNLLKTKTEGQARLAEIERILGEDL